MKGYKMKTHNGANEIKKEGKFFLLSRYCSYDGKTRGCKISIADVLKGFRECNSLKMFQAKVLIGSGIHAKLDNLPTPKNGQRRNYGPFKELICEQIALLVKGKELSKINSWQATFPSNKAKVEKKTTKKVVKPKKVKVKAEKVLPLNIANIQN